MIKWKRIEPGEYESTDKRFSITQTYDRIYGDHWVLQDSQNPDRYKGRYDEKTLRDCKAKAENLSESEEKQ
jgi:hypothetical protein